MPLARRLALLAWARSTNAYVVEDDYDSEFRYDGRRSNPCKPWIAPDTSFTSAPCRRHYSRHSGLVSSSCHPHCGNRYWPSSICPTNTLRACCNRCWRTSSAKGTSSGTSGACASKMPSGARCSCKHCLIAFGEAAVIQGASAGLHLTLRFPEVAEARTTDIIEAARSVGVAVYSVSPYYVRTPKSAGLLLGYAALSPQEIRSGILRLGQAFDRTLSNGPRQPSTPGRQRARR